VVQFRHTCETVHSTVRYGTVTRAVICDSARAGLGPKLSHKTMVKMLPNLSESLKRAIKKIVIYGVE